MCPVTLSDPLTDRPTDFHSVSDRLSSAVKLQEKWKEGTKQAGARSGTHTKHPNMLQTNRIVSGRQNVAHMSRSCTSAPVISRKQARMSTACAAAAAKQISFKKYQGLGNDFILVRLSFPTELPSHTPLIYHRFPGLFPTLLCQPP